MVFRTKTKRDKADFVEEISEIVDLDLPSLKNMSKKDLEKLFSVFNDPSKLLSIAVHRARGKIREELLDKRLGDLLEEDEEGGGGLLGFGLRDKIKNRRRLLGR